MTYSVEYIVNTGSYEHALFKIEEPDIEAFEASMGFVQASLLERIGMLGALAKGAVSYGYANPDEVDKPEPQAMELIKSELGGKVLEVTENLYTGPEPSGEQASMDLGRVESAAASMAPSRPWNRQPEVKQDKPWTAGKVASTPKPVKQAVDSDDFFD
jgi:hypothetical protein